MANLRDIVANATRRPWGESVLILAAGGRQHHAEFIATYDPKHIALMEAALKEASDLLWIHAKTVSVAGRDLAHYRKENGYE